jgi:hypothetical protein
MRYSNLKSLLAISCIVATAPLYALQSNAEVGENVAREAEAEPGEITVVGNSKSFKLKGKQLQAMVRAYEKGRTEYAPNSRLFFHVAVSGGGSLDDIQLSLATDEDNIEIIPDKNGRFTLPPLPKKAKTYELISNQNKKAIKLTPLVLSPPDNVDDRRLGDFRLECRVLWAADTSFFALKGMFDLIGGCNSSKVAFYFRSFKPVSEMFIDGAESEDKYALRGEGAMYRPPIYNKNLGNDARVTFTHIE